MPAISSFSGESARRAEPDETWQIAIKALSNQQMRLLKSFWPVFVVLLLLSTAGCGTFIANQLTQAPKAYPTWFAPKARVMLGFSPKFLTSFPREYVPVGPPEAKLCYRVVEPADYNLRATETNWFEHGHHKFDFTFAADFPAAPNRWTASPRGTVVLLHGYALAQFSMAPWALRLAQDGWRCVLVDLRGHGRSTGGRVYFGLHETHDLSQLLDQLDRDGQLTGPVAAMGESYGAALALRWKNEEPRVKSVVAIAPYAVLSNAVLNLRSDYAPWVPKYFIKAGLKKLPKVLGVQPGALDPETVMEKSPISALFIAGTDDKIMPLAEVRRLEKLARPDSKLIVVPHATHESIIYFFPDIAQPILAWLDASAGGK
ncbi:MAG TPA: alpha/beta fold hydrolase [Verrucomicrobiae bacterium]|jgi:pimeloyl-ACP methyl ester carboxylesterase|nr:alpha/beta fold hydrolase [Verrucomicrobiae bacterium]